MVKPRRQAVGYIYYALILSEECSPSRIHTNIDAEKEDKE